MIRVALIDDHELVRTGYRLILSAQPDIEIVGEAEDGQAGLQLLKRLEPDVALVDVQMPGLNGIEVTDRARRSNLRTRIVIVSMVSESPFPRRLLAAGASGYVTKGCAAAELVKAIRAVADGRRYLAASVADTYNHKASSQLRYIVNPPGSNVRVHQHLDIGQGEIDWDLFFKTLGEIKFDGVLSSCVFAWEDRAEDSSRFMRQEIQRYLDKYVK